LRYRNGEWLSGGARSPRATRRPTGILARARDSLKGITKRGDRRAQRRDMVEKYKDGLFEPTR
jgi:hypothetical protein